MADVARQHPVIQLPAKRGLCRVEAAGYIGVSPTTFDKLVADKMMPGPKRVGTRKIWDCRALDLAFGDLPGDDTSTNVGGDDNEWDEVLP